jgi:hypothetical protein
MEMSAAAEIIEQIDQDEMDAMSVGHSLYCYEVAMEIMWEGGRIAGPHDPKLLDEIRGDIAEQTYRCRCDEE